MEDVFAGNQALRRLFLAVIAFVAARANQFTGQQARVSLQRHTAGVTGMQARKKHAGGEQGRHARVQHVGYWGIDPFHGRAGTGRAIGGTVRKFLARGSGVAKGGEGVANLWTRQSRIVLHASQPVLGPAQGGHQLSWQAKWQVETADPVRRRSQGVHKGLLGFTLLQVRQLNHARTRAAPGQHDGFAFLRSAGKITAQQGGFAHVFNSRPRPSRRTPC